MEYLSIFSATVYNIKLSKKNFLVNSIDTEDYHMKGKIIRKNFSLLFYKHNNEHDDSSLHKFFVFFSLTGDLLQTNTYFRSTYFR